MEKIKVKTKWYDRLMSGAYIIMSLISGLGSLAIITIAIRQRDVLDAVLALFLWIIMLMYVFMLRSK